MNYQRKITHVWMIQVQLFMEEHSPNRKKWLSLHMLIQWYQDEQLHGLGHEILMMGTQGMHFRRDMYTQFFYISNMVDAVM